MMTHSDGEPYFAPNGLEKDGWNPVFPRPEKKGIYKIYLGHSYRDGGIKFGYSHWNGLRWSHHAYVLESLNVENRQYNPKQDYLWKEIGHD